MISVTVSPRELYHMSNIRSPLKTGSLFDRNSYAKSHDNENKPTGPGAVHPPQGYREIEETFSAGHLDG